MSARADRSRHYTGIETQLSMIVNFRCILTFYVLIGLFILDLSG